MTSMTPDAALQTSVKTRQRTVPHASGQTPDQSHHDHPQHNLQLQRVLGNHRVSQIMQSRLVQRDPDDDDAKDVALLAYKVAPGNYTEKQKQFARSDKRGLLLTASVIGKEEDRLSGQAPYPITVSKEKMRYGGGKLGEFVNDYNDFTYFSDEVLRGIGRLRDLLATGAPEEPGELTPAQLRALRPTDDSQASLQKKETYREWREAQARYATSNDTTNSAVPGGFVFDVAKTSRALDLDRQGFWQAKGKFERTVADAKRTQGNKPELDVLDVKFADLVGMINPYTAVAIGVDMAVNAHKKRAEWDKKMVEFAALIKDANSAIRDDFEAFKGASAKYWATLLAHSKAILDRDHARQESRQRAALLGQAIADPSEKRDTALAEVRMPILVADAWHALAVIGPPARRKLREVLNSSAIVIDALKHEKDYKPDPMALQDISQIRLAYNRTNSWKDVLAQGEVEWWVAVDNLWQETFTKFNV